MSTSLSTSATQMLNLHYAILGSQPTLTQLNAYAGTYKKAQTAGATADGALDAVATVILDSDAAINALMPNLAAPKTLATKLLANVGITNAAIVDFIAGFLDGTSNGGKPFPLSTAAVVISNYVASYKTGTSAYTAWDADLVAAQKVHSARAVPEPTGQTFTLTTGTDMVMAGATPDTINAPLGGSTASAATFSATDQIDGGAGTDSLYVETADSGASDNTAATLNLALVKNIERVIISNTKDSDGVVVTLPTDKMATALVNTNSTKNVTFDGIASGATTLDLNGVSAGTTLNYSSTLKALAGSADALTLALNGANGTVTIGGQDLVSNVLESIVVKASADSTLTLDLGATNLTSGITLSGAGKTTLAVSNASTSLKTVDASAATGAVVLSGISGPTSLAITGGAGSDSLTGGASNDVILGGAGNDTLAGGSSGKDSLDGGPGNDTVTIDSAIDKDDTVVGGDGVDTLRFTSDLTHSATSTAVQVGTRLSGFETIASGASVKVDVTGLAAGNTITTAVAAAGDLTVTKDTTIATVNFTDTTAARTVSVASAGAQTVGLGSSTSSTAVTGTLSTAATSLTVNGVNKLAAGSFNTLTLGPDADGVANATVATVTLTGADRIVFGGGTAITKVDASAVTATAGSGDYSVDLAIGASKGAVTYVAPAGSVKSKIATGAGADVIPLGDGADSVNSGAGADTITAGAGNDTIDSGSGNDFVTAGEGDDSVVETATNAGDNYLDGGAGNDTLTSGAGNDQLYGGDGNDSLTGNDGADTLSGGAGNDTISDGAGNDSILGGDGVDTITLGSGSDYVDAGAGNDIINSANTLAAGDTVTGGDGVDSLRITGFSGSSVPTITSIESVGLTAAAAGGTFGVKNVTDGSVKTISVTGGDTVTGAITLNDLLSGSTVNLSDDSTTDTEPAATTDNTGTLDGVIIVGMAANSLGALTVNINPNVDSPYGNIGSSISALSVGSTSGTEAGSLTINAAGGTSANRLSGTNGHTLGGIASPGTTSLTVVGADYSSLTNSPSADPGYTAAYGSAADVVRAAAAPSILINTPALTNLSLSTGVGSTVLLGAIAAPITDLSVKAAGAGSRADVVSITGASASAVTVSATGGATANVGSITTTGTLASLSISATDRGSAFGSSSLNNTGTVSKATVTVGSQASGGALTLTGTTFADLAITVGADATFAGATVTGAITKLTYAPDQYATLNGAVAVGGSAVTTLNLTLAGSSAITTNVDANVTTDIVKAGTTSVLSYTATSQFSKGTIDLSGTSGGSTFDLTGATATADSGTTVYGHGFTLLGGSGVDNLTGAGGNDSISGGAGADVLVGGAGADTISGGAGNDSITGGTGADTIDVGAGSDTVTLGSAADSGSATFVNGTNTGNSATTIDAGDSWTVTGVDVITGLSIGDTLDLFGTAAPVSKALDGAGTLTVTSAATGNYGVARGTFTAGTTAGSGSFAYSATGADWLVLYDDDGTGAGVSIDAVVLIGTATTATTPLAPTFG